MAVDASAVPRDIWRRSVRTVVALAKRTEYRTLSRRTRDSTRIPAAVSIPRRRGRVLVEEDDGYELQKFKGNEANIPAEILGFSI